MDVGPGLVNLLGFDQQPADMNSEFGGDIFDDGPPSPTPPRKGGSKERSTSVRKVQLKSQPRQEDVDDLTFPEATEPPPSAGGEEVRRDEPRRNEGRREEGRREEGRGDPERPRAPRRERDRADRGDRAERGDRGGRGKRGGPRREQAPVESEVMPPDPIAAPELPELEDVEIAEEVILEMPFELEEPELPASLLEEEDDEAEGDEAGPEAEAEDEGELFEPSPAPVREDDERGQGGGRRRRRRRGRDRDRDVERGPERAPQDRGPEPGRPERPVEERPREDRMREQRPRDDRRHEGRPRDERRDDRGRGDRGPHDRHREERPAPPRAVPAMERPGGRGPDRPGAFTPPPSTSGRPAPATQRVALFLDVDALEREARTLGGQVAFSRVLRQVAGVRTLSRAIAYCTPQSRGTGGVAGLETVRVEREAETPVAIAVDALATSPRVDCVVIVPESAATGPLVRALRANGVRVESAGFENRGPSEVADHQRLGKEALFSP